MNSPADPLRPVLRMAWVGVGLLALTLLALIAVSVFLPSTWRVSRETLIRGDAQEVFRLVADLQEWDRWTHWPDLEGLEAGPESGAGARRSWDDPSYGDGVLTITAIQPPTAVAYTVLVEAGSIRIEGLFSFFPEPGGTRVHWVEEGDFGWNPLLRYMALGIDRMQGTELERALDRLKSIVESDSPTLSPSGSGERQ